MDNDTLKDLLISPIHRALTAQENARHTGKGINPYRASSAGECPRRLAYAYHFPEFREPADMRFLTNMEIGNAVHDAVDRWLKLAGISVVQSEVQGEIEIISGKKLRPKFDHILKLGGEKVITDVKSKSNASFEAFRRKGMSRKERGQLHCYALMTGIKRMAILAVNKESGELLTDYCDYDPVFMSWVRENFRQVARSTPDQLPERLYPLKPFAKMYKRDTHKNQFEMHAPAECNFCPFRERCWTEAGLTKQQREDEERTPILSRPMLDLEKDLYLAQEGLL